MAVTRFSISIEEDIAHELDQYVIDNQFANRSQALRHLIEKNIVEKKWQCNNEVAGAIVLTYPHYKNEISSQINEICHSACDEVLSSQRFYVAHDTCLEIIAIKGISRNLTALSDRLIAIKGIRHGKLIMSKTD